MELKLKSVFMAAPSPLGKALKVKKTYTLEKAMHLTVYSL
jgi:hypothetical protein